MAKKKANAARIAVLLGMAAVAAAGCDIATVSVEPEAVRDAGNAGKNSASTKEIRLAEGVAVKPQQSRAAAERKSPTKFDEGEKVYAYVFNNDYSTIHDDWQHIEFVSDGKTKFTAADDRKVYYPQKEGDYPEEILDFENSRMVDVFVIHPDIIGDQFIHSNTYDHVVEADQTNKDGYLKSDLLYGSAKGASEGPGPVLVIFYHILSKVQVAITPGDGVTADDLAGAKIEILNTNRKAAFTPGNSAVTSVEEAGTLTPGTDPADIAPITIGNDVSANFGAAAGTNWNHGIFVPQTMAGDTEFIRITLNAGDPNPDNRKALDSRTPPEGKEFKQGTAYRYKVTVDGTGGDMKLTVTEEVGAWFDGEEEVVDLGPGA